MEFSAVTDRTSGDWQQWGGRNIAVRDGGIELDSEPSLAVERLPQSARDITVGADRTLYTLQPSGAVYRHDHQRSVEDRLWTAETDTDPRAICVLGHRLYVVDGTGTLTVVSTRRQQFIGRIETEIGEPVTMTAADGQLYLLDGEAGTVYVLQSDGTVEPVVDSLSRPIDMALDGAGTIYVLDSPADHRTVQKQVSTGDLLDGRILVGRKRCLKAYRIAGAATPNSDSISDLFPLSTFETTDGTSVTPTRITAGSSGLCLLGVVDEGGETLVGDLGPEGSAIRERHRFDERCRVCYTPPASAASVSYAVTEAGDCLRFEPTDAPACGPDGQYRGRAYRQFDAGASIQWHRLTVDYERATASSHLRLSYLASDDPTPLDEPLSAVTGLDDSLLSAAGIETVWALLSSDPAELAALDDERTTAEIADAFDAAMAAVETALSDQWQTVDPLVDDILLSEATGRYLTVRLELVGSPTVTPRVDSVCAFWPRQSYLQYLPELYQTDSASASFLEQFLSTFGTVFSGIEREIETVTQSLDPAAAPSEQLPWLADWIGADLPVDWPTAATRELLETAPERYRKRGTRDGLRELLGLYLSHLSPPEMSPGDRFVPTNGDERQPIDHGLCILEPQALDGTESTAVRAAYETALPGPHSVAVYAGPFDDPDHRAAVEAIIDAETPAHVRGSLVELEPAFRLGADSFLGNTTRLSERQFELGSTTLGGTAVLD